MFDIDHALSLLPRFMAGAGITLAVSLVGFALGTAIGALLLYLGRSDFTPARWFAAIYTSFIRGTPLLVQILVIFYALPGLTGVDLPPLAAGILALAFNSAAFIAEIFRAGMTRIDPGQYEAARALALPRAVIAFKIILPQLIRNVLPPLMSEFTMLVKASAILSVVTVVELTRTAQQIMTETYRPVEAFTVAAAIYFIILFAFSTLTRRLERKYAAAR
ncbi:amino acid ABC transporter permease [Oricola sp.]|uniref:amino acid ABC transporter permease n=1 Tax=Oricola sp. TaxID=1979950 RepID=UPI0025EC12F0|nr:amino acid ABC transporter permease [Oricola sp.]MCI5074103.1 amino acid ABC transporter permease [Oricola sp.]